LTRWTVHGERPLYESDWVRLSLADVWEVPAGRVDAGESPEEAAAREVLEETGWRPGPLRHLLGYHPISGLSDWRFDVFVADGAQREGEPDGVETDRVEWLPLPKILELIRSGQINDGFSLTALLRFAAA
jgi:8-oxo-dGTP pyrophosphatase MutT (NUDIX family)